MSLRLKLLLAQAPLAVALVLVGIVASVNVSSLRQHSEAILQDNYRSVLAAQRMKDAVERLNDFPARWLIEGGGPSLDAAAAAERQRFEGELRVQERNITESGEPDATQRVRGEWMRYQERFDQFRALSDVERARVFFREELEPAFTAVRDAADGILNINQDAMIEKSDVARRLAARTEVVTIVVTLAALLLGGVMSGTLTHRLLQPLGLLTRAVHRIGEGEFDSRVDVSGRDELALLGGTINAMATRLGQYRSSSLGELLLAQQASQAAIDSLPDPVVVFDLSGNILNVNTAAETLLGLGRESGSELAPAVREVLDRVRAHALAGKGPYIPSGFEEAVAVASPEGERHLLPRATPVYAESGSVTGVTVALQDVTRARLVDELRSDLVATVAHEFRTPLTSLRMAIHMCIERTAGPLTDKQSDLLYAAREDCERLQSMVDELLDLARIQGGRIVLDRRPTAPALLIEVALAAHQKIAAEHGVVLQTAVLPGVREVPVDRERLQLVLSNLLSNAIRHTAVGGSVEMRAKTVDDAVRFEVADSGEGIPAEYHASVFEKFVRVPGRVGGGAGLGLSIAREIVEAHGGAIGVEDTPGGGATFWFMIPTAIAEPPAAPIPVRPET